LSSSISHQRVFLSSNSDYSGL